MRRSTSCCSERSIKPSPIRARAKRRLSPLSLHAHLALRFRIGGKLLRAGRIAIVAQQEGREVHIRLGAELAWPVWRHQRGDIAEQRPDVARTPMLAEIGAPE